MSDGGKCLKNKEEKERRDTEFGEGSNVRYGGQGKSH